MTKWLPKSDRGRNKVTYPLLHTLFCGKLKFEGSSAKGVLSKGSIFPGKNREAVTVSFERHTPQKVGTRSRAASTQGSLQACAFAGAPKPRIQSISGKVLPAIFCRNLRRPENAKGGGQKRGGGKTSRGDPPWKAVSDPLHLGTFCPPLFHFS